MCDTNEVPLPKPLRIVSNWWFPIWAGQGELQPMEQADGDTVDGSPMDVASATEEATQVSSVNIFFNVDNVCASGFL